MSQSATKKANKIQSNRYPTKVQNNHENKLNISKSQQMALQLLSECVHGSLVQWERLLKHSLLCCEPGVKNQQQTLIRRPQIPTGISRAQWLFNVGRWPDRWQGSCNDAFFCFFCFHTYDFII